MYPAWDLVFLQNAVHSTSLSVAINTASDLEQMAVETTFFAALRQIWTPISSSKLGNRADMASWGKTGLRWCNARDKKKKTESECVWQPEPRFVETFLASGGFVVQKLKVSELNVIKVFQAFSTDLPLVLYDQGGAVQGESERGKSFPGNTESQD